MVKKYIFILFATAVLTGCRAHNPAEIKIAEQYGLAYAPLQIMKTKGFLERELGEKYTVEWIKLANTAAIREAMLAEDLDVGFVGIPPFLIGLDQGMPWGIMTGLSISPVGLVTDDPNIQTLEDLLDKGKIALPQPGSIQHILLSMAAKKNLGKADIFDRQLISMKHPDGYQALLADTEVKAHFTSPPYLFQELDQPSTHLIVTGEEAAGEPFSFIVGVSQDSFLKNTKQYSAFMNALSQSIEYMQDFPEETVQILSERYGLEPAVIDDYLYHRGMIYQQEVVGLDHFISFMEQEGYISKHYSKEEVIWE